MANYLKIGGIGVYIGAASDTKPATCLRGSRCYEYDTRKWYITHNGGTTWTQMQDLDAIVLGATTDGTYIGDIKFGEGLPANSGVDIGDVTLNAGTAAIGKVGHDKSGVADGTRTVTTPLTDVPIVTSSTPAKVVIVQAQTDNTGAVAVGGEGVVATIASGTGIILYAGDSVTLEVDDLADVWIDAIVGGEGVRFTYLT